MREKIKEAVLNGILLLVRPIIRLALRNGVTFREFTDLCRQGYVQVASDDYGLAGRSTNISRMAMMTGINRKDIKRLKDSLLSGHAEYGAANPDRIARILAGWHQDRDFLDHQKQPLLLPMDGDVSFTTLVKRYGGDIAPVSLLKEFKRSGVITEASANCWQILKRNYIPNPHANPDKCPDFIDPKALLHASSILDDHITTIFHNLYREETQLPQRFERRASNHRIRKDAVADFRILVERLGQEFLEEIDQWLSNNEAHDDADSSEYVRLGTGTYWIENENPKRESTTA